MNAIFSLVYSSIKAGVRIAVKIATIVSATVDIATCLNSLRSTRLDVPITWLDAPIDKPIATSLSILNSFKILLPNNAPKIPVIITAQAVSSGMPPIVFEISTAIGVVTDFGSIEIIMDNFVWKNFPRNATDTIAMHVANKKPKYIARLFWVRISLFLIKG